MSEPLENEDARHIVECIGEAIYQLDNHGLDPKRPYNGQPHTDQGVRGQTEVRGLTMRDVMDCFVIGWLRANGKGSLVEAADFTYNDIYLHGGECDIDPLAAMQNMSCEMERRMGIYPNVPGLEAAP